MGLPGLLQQEEGPLAGLPLLVEGAELVYRLEVVVDLGGKVNLLMGRYLLKRGKVVKVVQGIISKTYMVHKDCLKGCEH